MVCFAVNGILNWINYWRQDSQGRAQAVHCWRLFSGHAEEILAAPWDGKGKTDFDFSQDCRQCCEWNFQGEHTIYLILKLVIEKQILGEKPGQPYPVARWLFIVLILNAVW